MNKTVVSILTAVLLFFCTSVSFAQPKGGGMPPAKVVVAEVRQKAVAPEKEFIGTVYFQEVSKVASEVGGLVESVSIEAGQRVTKGQVMALLGSDILEKRIQAAKALLQQTGADVQNAKNEFQRTEKLFAEELVSVQLYDNVRFRLKSLQSRALSLEADLQGLQTEMEKKKILAPFDGIVLSENIDRGEWISIGSEIAVVARDNRIEVMVEVPSDILKYITPGLAVEIAAGGQKLKGSVYAVIPRGNVSTRTFPVRIVAENRAGLAEGMEARVTLPTGKRVMALSVPRDALTTVMGMTVIYAVQDSKAFQITVTPLGYDGLTVGLEAPGLSQGMQVVIKGNERLRNGQDLMISK
ncbi:MAG: efflux RND transporter periplasmic adaptor subunit [Nitrospira sp.]|nr:efflux RND transporter periplasmic adaptor subunit [Nitrospira sp.]